MSCNGRRSASTSAAPRSPAGCVDVDGQILERGRRETPAPQQEPAGRRGHHRRRWSPSWRARPRDRRGRHRRGRVRRRDPGRPCCSRRTCPGATSRCATPSSQRLRLPVVVENDANAAAVGRVAVRCRSGRGPPGLRQPRHRHRRRDHDRRRAAAREVRRGRRVRPHAGRARRAPVRVRQPRLLGAVRQRQRAGPRGARAGRRRAHRSRTACSTGSAAIRPSITGPLVTEAAKDGDPAAIELFEEVGRWLGIGLANLAAAFDPGGVRHRRRGLRGRRAAARPGAGGVPAAADRTRLPARGPRACGPSSATRPA